MFNLPLWSHPQPSREPISPQTAAKASRLRGATVTEASVPTAPSAAASSSTPRPASSSTSRATPQPDQRGHALPQGRQRVPAGRQPAPGEAGPLPGPLLRPLGDAALDWALDQIAQRVKAARDADFTARDEEGRLLNSVRNIGTLGGATLDIEENYLIKKLFCGGLGVVSIENQARI